MALKFDLVDINLFVGIVDTNSLTHAAELSNISLPAASTRIKNIEERIGTKLLYRNAHCVELTPAGRSFLHHGRLMLQQLEHLQGELQEYAQGVKGHLRIWATTTPISEFLPAVLRKYLATHPDVDVDIRERGSPDIVSAVRQAATDIGIFTSDGLFANICTDGLDVLPYRRDRLVVATSPAHALACRETVSFAETLEFGYVCLRAASANVTLRHAAGTANKPMKIRIQVDNFETLCQMVEINVGIAALSETIARRFAKTMAIHLIPLNDDWAMRNFSVCVRNVQSLPKFARDVVGLLVADANSMVGSRSQREAS